MDFAADVRQGLGFHTGLDRPPEHFPVLSRVGNRRRGLDTPDASIMSIKFRSHRALAGPSQIHAIGLPIRHHAVYHNSIATSVWSWRSPRERF